MLKILRANFFEDEIEYKRDFEYFNRHELMFREIGNVRYLPSDD